MDRLLIERAFSKPRFFRFFIASGKDWGRAVDLYRANIRLSSRLFSAISIFEVILRNSIDEHYKNKFGNNWLHTQSEPPGFFATIGCENSRRNLVDTIHTIQKFSGQYTHDKAIATLSFSFWRYLFGPKEFLAAGSTLLSIFPQKPVGPSFNHTYVFKTLTEINNMRNRIAHHEPVCFLPKQAVISCWPATQAYIAIKEILEWLDFDPKLVLKEVDFVLDELKCLHG